MTARPWMKFYPADWRADPKLRMCGLAARGLWMDMLALMHEADPYGHLVITGIAPDAKQLSSIVGAPQKEVAKALRELEEANVFSRTGEGVIFSRRMVRDRDKSLEGRKWIEKRWGDEPPNSDPTHPPNSPPNRSPTQTPITPEARSQSPEARKGEKGKTDYAFFGDVIRLTWPDFARWQESFRHIPDLRAELQRLDDFYSANLSPDERKKWFPRVSAALAKANKAHAGSGNAGQPDEGQSKWAI